MSDTNIWSPSGDELNTWDSKDYQDEPDATPMSEEPGHEHDRGGTDPDVRANLLTDVRAPQVAPLPVQEVHHVVETVDQSSDTVRTRIIVVTSQTQPVEILAQNPRRKRGLIRITRPTNTFPAGIGACILLSPSRIGGIAFNYTDPVQFLIQPPVGFPLYDVDGIFETKSQDGIEAVGVLTPPAVIQVSVWEELYGPTYTPGL